MKANKKVIEKRYFDEILERGQCVPRNLNGDTLVAVTSRIYTLVCRETERELNTICTQNCPVNFKIVEL